MIRYDQIRYISFVHYHFTKGRETTKDTTQVRTRKGKAMFNLTKSEKAVFGKLASDGHDLYVNGDGWHFDGLCFESFSEFFKFCQSQVDD